MKKWKIFGVVLFILFINGCEKDEDLTISLDQEVAFRMERRYSVLPRLSLEIEELNESRCPRGVFCFWQGEAKVWIRVNQSKGVGANDGERLMLSTLEPQSLTYAGYRFELIDVEPYPELDKSTSKSEIRVVLKISEAL